jgi:TPR repeat protein
MMDRKFKAGMTALALVVIAGSVTGFGYLMQDPDLSSLPPAQVDRMRMMAGPGQDQSAMRQLRLAARQGNIEAQRAAASVLLTSKDATLVGDGLRYAEMAAKHGDAEACFLLGKANFEGVATGNRVPDFGRARHWFEMAAEHHHAKATYLLGILYKSGYGIAPDPVMAAQWFEKAVQLGDANAMFMLGNAYLAGQGVTASPDRALHLYQAAAALEHPLAAQTLAFAFRDGAMGLSKSEKESNQMMMEVAHTLSHPDPS